MVSEDTEGSALWSVILLVLGRLSIKLWFEVVLNMQQFNRFFFPVKYRWSKNVNGALNMYLCIAVPSGNDPLLYC